MQHTQFQQFDGGIRDKDEVIQSLKQELANNRERHIQELDQALQDAERRAQQSTPCVFAGSSTQPYATPVEKKTLNIVATVAHAAPVPEARMTERKGTRKNAIFGGLGPVFSQDVKNVVVMQILVCWWQRKTASCVNSNWAKNLSQITLQGSASKTVPLFVEIYIMTAISIPIVSLFLYQPAMSLIHGPIAQSIM